MSARLGSATITVLRALQPNQLRALFAAARANDDAALLAAIHPPKMKATRRAVDPLVAEVHATLKPILASAGEKAAYLSARLEEATGISGAPAAGFAQTVRFWAGKVGAERVRGEAQALIAALAQDSRRESIP